MMRWVHKSAAMFTLAFAVVPLQAHAAPNEPPADGGSGAAMTQQARELHLKGVGLFREGRYKAARAALTAAYRIKRHYQIAGALGACELKLDHPREAAQYLHHFLRELPASATKKEREGTTKMLQQAAAKVGRIDLTISQSGAELDLDDRPLQLATDSVLFLDPGDHTIQARLSGFDTARVSVKVVAGGAQKITITLEPFVGGDSAAGGPSKVVIGVGLGLGAVMTGTAIGLTVAANGKSGDIDAFAAEIGGDNSACAGASAPARCADLQGAADSQQTLTGAAIGSWVAGGALLLGTGIYYFVGSDPAPDQTALPLVVPTVAPGHAGLTLLGRF